MNFKHPLVLSTGLLILFGVSSVVYQVLAQDGMPKSLVLSVPSITQAPGGNWSNPWGNACEEASATMVEAFYANKRISQSEANKEMSRFFRWEDATIGYNEDTDAQTIVEMIEATSSFKAVAIAYPTIGDIKNELKGRRPVIALVNQFDFYRKKPTKRKGDSYHVFVIIGYDDPKKQFIINDPAEVAIKRYSYDRVMEALHDLDSEGEATGKPVVIFTSKTGW
jgi:uncharacterized protein YvpB